MKHLFIFFSLIFLWNGLANGQEIITVDIAEQYKKGVAAMNNFQYQKAAEHFFECHREDYRNKDYLQKLAFCYSKLGDYAEAKLSYKTLLKMDSLNVNAWSNLGSIYEKELNFPKAKNCYQQLLTIDSTNSYYYRQNGFMALKTKDPIGAVFHFMQSHELNERDLIVINELSGLLLQFNQPDEALKMIEKGLQFSPNNFKLLYTKADIVHHQKKYEEVITTVNHTFSLGDTVSFYQKMIGAAYLRQEQFDSCIYHLDQIVEKKEDSEITHYQLALAHAGKQDFEKSTAEYELAIDKAISENTGLYFKNMAMIFDEQKKLRPAIAAWKKAIEYSPDQPIYYFYLAIDCDNYYKDKKIALKYYEKYLKSKEPTYVDYTKERIQYLKRLMHQQGR